MFDSIVTQTDDEFVKKSNTRSRVRSMIKIPFQLAICLVAISAFEVADGQNLKPIFDGRTLDGWTRRGGDADYRVADAAIVGTSVPNTPNTFLCTDKMYSDFVLELEYKVHPELNSGIQIRSNSNPDYKNGRVHGYQVEIDPSDRSYSSGIYDEARRGWLFDLNGRTAARYAFRQNQWNHVRIIAKGNRLVTYLNGVLAANLIDNKTASGFIALQVHGVGGRKDPLDVRWRNIRLSEDVTEVALPETSEANSQFDGVIVSENSKIQKLGGGFKFTEGPALGPDGRIYFSDIPNRRVNVYDPSDHSISSYREDSGKSNGLMWTANDALISCEGENRQVTRHFLGGGYQVLAKKFKGKKLNSPNDLAFDGSGGIYFTDPRYGDRSDMEMEIEGVYFVNSKGKGLQRIIDDLVRPNGLIMSNDFKYLYVADQGAGKTFRYTVDKPGQISNKTPFAPIGSDGMTIDDFGNVYLTHGKYVHVFSAGGKKICNIEFPEAPSNVTFGGADRKTLFVTARTGFYAVETNVTGGQARANPE